IIFYSAIFSALVVIIIALNCIHDGKFELNFVLWRVIVSFPLVIIAYIFRQLLTELRKYPKLLMKKHTWTIKELMELTDKDQKETENIISHVLESCFIVDEKNILKEE
ncbi:MAG: hypothetical protein J6S49_00420, partial [Erysipelotrichaceae bacterium]|nr:hypothetical protein [Erysipelotrichaceae bacterium]